MVPSLDNITFYTVQPVNSENRLAINVGDGKRAVLLFTDLNDISPFLRKCGRLTYEIARVDDFGKFVDTAHEQQLNVIINPVIDEEFTLTGTILWWHLTKLD